MNDTEFFSLLAAAITVNSITGQASQLLDALLTRRVSQFASESLPRKLLCDKNKNSFFGMLNRLMLVEVIWAILQMMGLFSLQRCPVCLAFLLFLPQLFLGLAYLLIVWHMGISLSRKRFCGCSTRGKVSIISFLPIFVLSEPLCPMIADWAIEQINEVEQKSLPNPDGEGTDSTFPPSDLAQQEDVRNNRKRMKQKYLRKGHHK